MISIKELFNVLSVVCVLLSESTSAYKTGCNGGYCFVVSDYTNNNEVQYQSNAVQWCLSNNSQLVEIVNSDIQNSLVNVIQNSFPGISGGYNFFTNGKRSTTSDWFRLNRANRGSITINEQFGESYAYGYLRWSNSGFDIYASRPYDVKEGYICSGVYDCTNGVTINGQCYKAYTGTNNTIAWYDARDRCVDEGGDLSSFGYITTNAGFNALNTSWMGLNTSYRYWIGFRREFWTWQRSNQDVKYSDWLINHPTNNYNCLCLTTWQSPWQWIECDCNQQNPFVCLSSIQSSTSISTSTTTVPKSSSTSGPTPPIDQAGSSSTSQSTVSGSYATSTSTALSSNNTDLSEGAKIGIGVGIGVGGFLIIAAIVVVVVIIMMRKRLAKKGESQRNLQTPDLITTQGNAVVHPDKESQTYATVVGHNDNTYKSAMAINQPTEYAELKILSSSTPPASEYSNSPSQPRQTEPYLSESM